jgi:hypothetical protein
LRERLDDFVGRLDHGRTLDHRLGP